MIKKTKTKKNTPKKSKGKAKKNTPKKSKGKAKKAKSKKKEDSNDLDIVFVDEDVIIDKESELEARRAYLEEARSQESSGD